MSAQYQIPNTPRVISPSPTPSESSARDGYFPPQTRSKTAGRRVGAVEPIEEQTDSDALGEEDPALRRARSRSRSPRLERKPTNMSLTAGAPAGITSTTTRRKADGSTKAPNGALGVDKPGNGLLSPDSAYPEGQGFGASYWRNLSRSPSPLGLIPIHREWREFVHKHEVPRKLLHVSIGFMTLWLYYKGLQKDQIHPALLTLLIPIFSVDVVRFRWPAFNHLYIKHLGGFMRESEAHDRYNGVISYIAGVWATMYFCRKDVAVVTVLLLSWCDTAASTFGRLWGKYTPRIRKGKSLAGSLAAFVFGVFSAVLFWQYVAPTNPSQVTYGAGGFAFEGTLTLPTPIRAQLNLNKSQATISGAAALGCLSIVTGLVVSVSEAVDLWGLDDNLTIPVLSGALLDLFLWAFRSS